MNLTRVIERAIEDALSKYAKEKAEELKEKYVMEFANAIIEKRNELVLNVVSGIKIEHESDFSSGMINVNILLRN